MDSGLIAALEFLVGKCLLWEIVSTEDVTKKMSRKRQQKFLSKEKNSTNQEEVFSVQSLLFMAMCRLLFFSQRITSNSFGLGKGSKIIMDRIDI